MHKNKFIEGKDRWKCEKLVVPPIPSALSFSLKIVGRFKLIRKPDFIALKRTYSLLSLTRKNICNLIGLEEYNIGRICTLFSIFVPFGKIRKKIQHSNSVTEK